MMIELRSVGFGNDGLSFEYIDFASDVRSNGMIANHALLVPDNDEFGDEIDEIRKLLTAMLEGMLEDWGHARPLTPPEPDDEGPSPYDNPLERELGSPS